MARKITEEKIENAAISLFAESGYKGTSTRRIAKEAGVSELTIYRCYKTKEELFRQALLNQMPDKWLDKTTFNSNQTLEEQLTGLFQRLYETLEKRQDLIRIFYREGSESSEIVDLAKQIPPKIWGPMKDYLLQVSPSVSVASATEVAFQIFSGYLGMCLLSFTFGQDLIPISIEEYHHSCTKMCTRMLTEAGYGQ